MAKAKKAISVKTSPLTIDGDEYLVRTNVTMRTIADLNSGDYDRVIKAFGVVVIEQPWEGDPGDWTDELAGAFLEAYGALLKALPPA